MIVDIRTSTISRNKSKKFIRDKLIKIESRLFNKTTIITCKVAEKLKIKIYDEVPLGATVVINEDNLMKKEKEKIRLLYVGAFNEREIDKTIYAIKKIINKNPKIDIVYTIIGSSNNKLEDEYLRNLIIENKLDRYVNLVGRIPHNELNKYYECNNIGLSFIPINENFDLQPPTKTYEYIMNGLFCLATNTTANREIVNEDNGLLIDDSIDSIVDGLEKIYTNIQNIDYLKVNQSLSKTSWDFIVNEKLIPIIEDLISSN